jgi:hypothetical protein
MGNKKSLPAMSDVEVHPRCVHRGCTVPSFAGFVMCLDHIIEAKRKQLEEEELKSNTKKNGTVSEHS